MRFPDLAAEQAAQLDLQVRTAAAFDFPGLILVGLLDRARARV